MPNSTDMINDTVQNKMLLVTDKKVGLKAALADQDGLTLSYAAWKRVPQSWGSTRESAAFKRNQPTPWPHQQQAISRSEMASRLVCLDQIDEISRCHVTFENKHLQYLKLDPFRDPQSVQVIKH